MNENVQLQDGLAVQIAVAEEDTAGDTDRYSIAKLVGIVILVIVVVFTVFIGVRGGQERAPRQNPVDIGDLEKEIINTDNLDTEDLPLELVD